MRMLAIDNKVYTGSLVSGILKDTKYQNIHTIDNGHAALRLLGNPKNRFDCLLLGADVEGLDGAALCSHIRALPAHIRTPIVALTSQPCLKNMENAFRAGATDFVIDQPSIKPLIERLHVLERMLQSTEPAPRLNPLSTESTGAAGIHNFSLNDAVYVQGVDRLILPFALGSYLLQMPRSQLDNSQVFAVRIESIEEHYALRTSQQMARMLEAVASALINALEFENFLMAYVGNGVLMSVVTAKCIHEWPQINVRMNTILDQAFNSKEENNVSLPVEVSVGGLTQPSASLRQRVRRSFDRALSKLDIRDAAPSRAFCADPIRMSAFY